MTLSAAPVSGTDMVHVRVADDGPGMTDEVRRRCLEPLFSTKPRAVSSGLGLAFVQTLVTRAGGRVDIESTLGRGTSVTLVLPGARLARQIQETPAAGAVWAL